jgi:demethoxyubiquinone hydroxylase (CLK1/Coq7/Cat5 family)
MSYDVSIIRPEMHEDDVRMRVGAARGRDAAAIRNGLVTLHTLELMAVNIYKYQTTSAETEHNRLLVAAMCNEMTHLQDFQVKLFEHGWRPSRLRWAYWVVGWLFGTVSRLRGPGAILRMGIWVETKAVRHYARLLGTVPWDERTRHIIEKNRADEEGHVARWKNLLGKRP